MNSSAPKPETKPAPASPTVAAASDAPTGWFARHGVSVLMVALLSAAAVYFLRDDDDRFSTVFALAKVVVGLGLVIFVHELGHFLAAKWCDVHVQTFSIGFGPPFLGLCSFQRGETTYKIAWFPLGGYVKMLGEGQENEEAEDDPRSYKNKSVARRMIIISAGVVMNLLMAGVCFMAVYMTRGVKEAPAVIGHTEAGGPAWQKGLRPGSRIEKIGDRASPFYEELQRVVFNSRRGQALPLTFDWYDNGKVERHDIEIVPARGDDIPLPMIGIRSANIPVLVSKTRDLETPSLPESPAARAKPALAFGDRIVGATDPEHPAEVTPLAPDPRRPGSGERDYFDLRRRLHRLVGQPITLRVERAGSIVDAVIPPAYSPALGLRMRMGEVVAVRENSPAAKAGLLAKQAAAPGDIITAVELSRPDGSRLVYSATPSAGEEPLDPLRLPTQLALWAESKPKDLRMKLTVLRPEGHKGQVPAQLTMTWDPDWELFDDLPWRPDTPVTLAGLGIAYRVRSVIEGIDKGGSADGTALKPGDVVTEIEYKIQPLKGKPKSERREVKEDQWAYYGSFLQEDLGIGIKEVILTVNKSDKISLTPREDANWPVPERGLLFEADVRVHKADGLLNALALGFRRVAIKTATIYENLISMVTGRLSPKAISGPVSIARVSFIIASKDDYEFILFLALININLAVVNFLPIPVLDGGHMVFLTYEAIRGKAPSETVRFVLTIVGLVVILSLFVFGTFLDVRRLL